MLVGSGIRNGGGPCRCLGAAHAAVASRGNWGQSGALRNLVAGFATVIDGSGVAELSGIPDGTRHPVCWSMPTKAGGLSARNNVAGQSTMGAAVTGGLNAICNITGTATVTANGVMLLLAAASLNGTGDVSTATMLGVLELTVAVSGTGTVSAAITAVQNLLADLVGTGDISTAAAAATMAALADLSGSATVGASLNATGVMQSSITGSGTLTPPVLQAIMQAVCAITGSSTISAALNAHANAVAALSGSSSTTGTPYATGAMQSSISVSGDLLTTTTVAQAVWGALAEGSITYDQMLRIIAAATAGKVSGGPSSPVFRNLSDTQDQITGAADSNGNRSGITYGD